MPRHQSYAQFLKTPFWKRISAQKKRLMGNRCEECGLTHHLQAHHIRYPSDWFRTSLEDLKVLCEGCHRKEHGLDMSRGHFSDDLDLENFFWWKSEIHTQMSRGKMPNKAVKKRLRRMMALYPDDRRVIFHARQTFKFIRIYELAFL